MKAYTEKELTLKAETYCASAERCPSDLEEKLRKWGASEDTLARVMAHLVEERYLDTTRYSRFFTRDKYRFNQWGRMKIIQALRMRHVPAEDIEAGLEEIDAQEYDNILRDLLEKKARSLKAASDYERNIRLVRFAAGRGFTMDEIMQHIRQGGFDEYPD